MTADDVVESQQDQPQGCGEMKEGSRCEASTEEVTERAEGSVEAGEVSRPVLSSEQQIGLLEALLLASGDPLPINRIQELLGVTKEEVLQLAESLKETYAEEKRGLELVNVSQKLQLRTKALYADYVRQLIAIRPRKLSQAALETLAVVAYQQPVVKSEIDKIRGVDVAPTLKTLLERKLVKILGYQASVGQPALYGTTEDFLSVFGLSTLAELPSLRDLKALVKEPGETQEGDENPEEQESSADGEDAGGAESEDGGAVEAQPTDSQTPNSQVTVQ